MTDGSALGLSTFDRLNPAWGCCTWDALFLYAVARQALPPEDAQTWASWACRPVWRATIRTEELTEAASALLGAPFADTPEECERIVATLEDRFDEGRRVYPTIPEALFMQVKRERYNT